MIVDTSAIMALLLQEVEAARLRTTLGDSEENHMSAGSLIELGAVLTRRGLDKWSSFETIRDKYHIRIAPTSSRQAEIGVAAYRRYGIGTKHPAQLNFGDCFAYALAIERGEPLLFKGDDFGHTDVIRAEY